MSGKYGWLACVVVLALLGAGLVTQNKRHDEALAQLASERTGQVNEFEARLAESARRVEQLQTQLDEQTKASGALLADSARQAAQLQAELDKLTAYRDGHFAQALAAFDEASAAAKKDHEGFTRAFTIWSDLAESGDTRANYHLGIMHMYGLGGAAFEQSIGIENVRIAAESGYPVAQSLMGFLVERSDGLFVKTGDAEALKWWQLGAQGNHCTAVRRMIKIYQDAELGVTADPAKADEWNARLANCNKR